MADVKTRIDTREWLSSGRTIDYANTIYLTTGHTLYSNRSRPMWTIVDDTVGRHDFLLTPCSPDTFRILYKHTGHHPSCFQNLAQADGRRIARAGSRLRSVRALIDPGHEIAKDRLRQSEMTLGDPAGRRGLPGDHRLGERGVVLHRAGALGSCAVAVLRALYPDVEVLVVARFEAQAKAATAPKPAAPPISATGSRIRCSIRSRRKNRRSRNRR